MADLENIGAPMESGEGAQMSAEQASEQREKARKTFVAARKKLQKAKKDEQQTKKREESLAALLSAFIKDIEGEANEQILNTAVAMLKQEVPAEFVVGILSLLYPALRTLMYESTEGELSLATYEERAKVLTLMHQPKEVVAEGKVFHHEELPIEVKDEVNTWIQVLMLSLSFHPEWILPRVYKEGKVLHSCIQLATFVFTQFLELYGIRGEYQQIRSFTEFVLQGVLQSLESPQKKV